MDPRSLLRVACAALCVTLLGACATARDPSSSPGAGPRGGPGADRAPPGRGGLRGPLLAVDGSIQAEPALETRLRVPRAQVEAEMQEVVGRAARPLARGKPEGLLGNLLTDVMRAHASEVTGKPVDVAFVNLGGLRADLPAGDLTRGALLEVMPFDNTLVVMEVKGTDLQAVFDRAALHDGDPVSGARYVVRARTAVEVTVGDAPLDPARTYRLCTSDYIADGGGRYESLKRATRVNRTGILIRDILLGHVERETAAGRPVDARITGRVRVSNAAPTPPPAAEATP